MQRKLNFFFLGSISVHLGAQDPVLQYYWYRKFINVLLSFCLDLSSIPVSEVV